MIHLEHETGIQADFSNLLHGIGLRMLAIEETRMASVVLRPTARAEEAICQVVALIRPDIQ